MLLSLKGLLVNKGIEVAATVDLTEFWQQLQASREVLAPKDMLIPLDDTLNELALVGRIRDQVEGIEGFHRHIRESYSRLPSDLKTVLAEMGIDPARVEGSKLARKLFEIRDWDWVTFFPNRTNSMRLALAHLRVKMLERMSHEDNWGPEQEQTLAAAKGELQKAVLECSVYYD